MNISVKCFATLAKYTPQPSDGYELPDGATAADLIERLGMQPEDVKIVFVNGTHAKHGQMLQDGDAVGLFPAIGGG